MERTFIAIKPDGVKRNLIGKIISRFEDKGYKLMGMKMLIPTQEMAQEHYKEHIGKPFYPRLVEYIKSGPIVAMIWAGQDIIAGTRKLMGATNPDNAEVGSIRFDYAQCMEVNVVHGSDSLENAEREIAIYFKPDEIYTDWKHFVSEYLEDECK